MIWGAAPTAAPPPGGGVGRGGAPYEKPCLVTPSPPLPRKRGREHTEFVAPLLITATARNNFVALQLVRSNDPGGPRWATD